MSVICTLHHHVGAEGPFERGLNIASARDAFEAQIDRLERDYDVIDLDTLLAGRLPRRPLLMTFDDAFRSVLDVARCVLAPRGLPAVFFVNPGLVGDSGGEEELSLDSTLAWAANTAGLERVCAALGIRPHRSLGTLIGEEMATRGAEARKKVKAQVLAAFGPPDLSGRAPLLRKEDLPALRALGVEIGNHTMTHVHCRALSESETEAEVLDAKHRLEALAGGEVRAFSVPYGHERDLTPELLGVLRASGHRAIFLVHARSNGHRPAPDVWYRTSLHDERPKDLPKKLRYMPLLRTLRHQVRR